MSEKILRQIAQLGHPILRKKTHPIPLAAILNKKFQDLIDDMITTVTDVDGVGIAAPQIYRCLQVFIVASKPNPRYPSAPPMRPTAMINPKIMTTAAEKVYGWEGCLSIPGIRGYTPRYQEVTVSYTSRTGKKIIKKLTGFIARIFQHEYDHIHGIVFLDKLDTTRHIITEKEYKKIIQKEMVQTITHDK